MSRHAPTDRIDSLLCEQGSSACPRGEPARGCETLQRTKSAFRLVGGLLPLALALISNSSFAATPCVAPACGAAGLSANAHPLGGQVVSGKGTITQSGATTTIRQSSQDLFLSWLSFNVGSGDTVDFLQPSANAIAVNRILGTNGSEILGHINANGDVWLLNPNGVVFGAGAQVNVGGLVASTLSEVSLVGNTASFSGSGTGSIENQGTINATNGGYVALVGNHVRNEGAINARLGTVALGAGSAVTVSFNGNSLVKMQVDQSTLKNLAENGGVIQADGGTVIMSAGAKNALLASVVNNTGVIEARTVTNHDGTIELLGGMTAGTVEVAGTLDASAPSGGAGGQIETSAAHVEVASATKVTTAAASGRYGMWLIDPQDFTVAASGGDMTGATLASQLGTTPVTLQSSSGGAAGSGNVSVNDAVSWSADTTLTLTASNNVNVNSAINSSGAAAGLVINPNTANGSETASGTGTLNIGAGASITLSGANAALSIATPSYTLGTGASINLPNVAPTSTTALVIGGTSYTVVNSLGAAGSTTAADLQGINGNLAAHYALGSNVDATPTSGWNGGAGFTPLGNSGTAFTGTFDGLGHTIGSLSINLPTTTDVGLFGATGSSAVIRNVGLTSGSVIGGNNVGMLVGLNAGRVAGSFVSGSVGGGNGAAGSAGVNGFANCTLFLITCHSYAPVAATDGGNGANGGAIGGLIGNNSGSVSSTFSTAQVNGGNGGNGGGGGNGISGTQGFYTAGANGGSGGTGGTVGGLIGINSGPVDASYATGSVSGGNGGSGGGGGVGANNNGSGGSGGNGGNGNAGGLAGGLIGSNSGMVSDSYATGAVSGSASGNGGNGGGSTITNGVFGGNGGNGGASNTAGSVGGLVAVNTGSIAASYATGAVSGSNGGTGGTGSAPNLSLGIGVGVTGSGSAGGAGGTLGGLVGSNSGAVTFDYATGTVSGGAGGNGGFGGAFAGNGGAGGTLGGLIGSDASGQINNSYATGAVSGGNGGTGGRAGGEQFSTLTPTTNQAGQGGVGGVGGALGGFVGFENQGTISASYATGTVDGGNGGTGGLSTIAFLGTALPIGKAGNGGKGGTLGGFVGSDNGAISGSYATGAVSSGNGGTGGLNDSDAAGGFGGNGGALGGFAGTVNHVVNDSYATGSVSGGNGGSVNTSDAQTSFEAQTGGNGGSLGGFAGSNAGTVNEVYSTGSVAGAAGGAGFAGVFQPGAAGVLGGLLGANAGTVSSSYWDVTTSHATSAGGTGLTTAQMQLQASFGGWAFADTWVVYAGHTFPLLQSFLTPLTVTANDATTTYNGQVANNNSGVNYSSAPNGNLLGTLVYGGSSAGASNAGNYVIAPGGLYSNQQGYLISFVNGALTINPLALTGAAISSANATYGSGFTPGTLSFSNVVAGDSVTAAVSIVDPLYSTSNHLSVGSYAQSASAVLAGPSASNYTFSGFTSPTSNYTVTPLTLTGATIATVNASYGTPAGTGAVSFGNLLSGDLVSSTASLVNPAYSSSGNVSAGNYAQTASSLIGADAGNYSFAGYTTPSNNYSVSPLSLSVSGLTASNKVYDGKNTASLNGTASIATIANDAVTLIGTGSATFADANVATGKGVTVTGYSLTGADAGDYAVAEPVGLTANISQLASVAWVGGATGNWSNAANWAGGAIPDLSNVAAVSIGAGKTVTYDSGVAGTTVLTSLTDSGKLIMAAGNLATTGNLVTAGYQQTGGQLNVGGALSINSTAGAVTLGNVTAGSAAVVSKAGAITQAASTALDVSGATSLIADDGVSGAEDVKYNITVANTGNHLTGAVAANGLNVKLLDASAGGLILGDTVASASLTATARAGAIAQASGTTVNAAGPISLTAVNGLAGAPAVKYDVDLAQAGNNFAGPITSNGHNISLADSNAGGLFLGNTTAQGTFSADATAGPITQVAFTAVTVTGTSNLAAGNGASAITLANGANNFVGAVTSNGSNIDLADGIGGLKLGATTATGTFTADALAGAITQVAGTTIGVTGASNLTADNGASGASDVKYAITLATATDHFGGVVTADGSAITLKDATALTAILDSSGASSLTAAGALNVSGTVGTSLTTKTTGAGHKTTFGATSVGTSLIVTSTGAVTSTAPGILTVDGAGTTTPNSHVTVNGTVGAVIQ